MKQSKRFRRCEDKMSDRSRLQWHFQSYPTDILLVPFWKGSACTVSHAPTTMESVEGPGCPLVQWDSHRMYKWLLNSGSKNYVCLRGQACIPWSQGIYKHRAEPEHPVLVGVKFFFLSLSFCVFLFTPQSQHTTCCSRGSPAVFTHVAHPEFGLGNQLDWIWIRNADICVHTYSSSWDNLNEVRIMVHVWKCVSF